MQVDITFNRFADETTIYVKRRESAKGAQDERGS